MSDPGNYQPVFFRMMLKELTTVRLNILQNLLARVRFDIMKTKIFILAFVIIISGLCVSGRDYSGPDYLRFHKDFLEDKKDILEFIPLRDTVYILSDKYISISLNEQKAVLHYRGDSVFTYKISSGTSRISKGVDTREGIYTVQLMARAAESRQFNNCKLLWWIGFNLNIGFHGLTTNSYYRHLGVKPTSHGCVRISREDGEDLYQRVSRGTPVLVYDSIPARIFAFADKSDFRHNKDIFLMKDSRQQHKLLEQRLTNLYNGEHFLKNKCRIFLHQDTILRPGGYPVGDGLQIPFRQLKPIDLKIGQLTRKDNLKINAEKNKIAGKDSTSVAVN